MIRYRRWGCAFLAVLILGVESALVCLPWLARLETALWLNDHVDVHSRIVADLAADEVEDLIDKNLIGHKLFSLSISTWNWQFTPTVESRSPSAWLGQTGAHYLVIDERSLPDQTFAQRIQALESQGATLLYMTPSLLSLPRQAILWTFRPDHLLNVTFDSDLLLVGYNVNTASNGSLSLLLHWYTDQPPPAAYHLFVHQINPATGSETERVDAAVGGDSHLTNSWRKGEIVFDSVALPTSVHIGDHLRIGLYVFGTGTHALIKDSQQTTLGDHLDFSLS